MKVVCVNNNLNNFTAGKTYNIKPIQQRQVGVGRRVMDDNGISRWFFKEDFLPIEDWRQKQLEILLDTNMSK